MHALQCFFWYFEPLRSKERERRSAKSGVAPEKKSGALAPKKGAPLLGARSCPSPVLSTRYPILVFTYPVPTLYSTNYVTSYHDRLIQNYTIQWYIFSVHKPVKFETNIKITQYEKVKSYKNKCVKLTSVNHSSNKADCVSQNLFKFNQVYFFVLLIISTKTFTIMITISSKRSQEWNKKHRYATRSASSGNYYIFPKSPHQLLIMLLKC